LLSAEPAAQPPHPLSASSSPSITHFPLTIFSKNRPDYTLPHPCCLVFFHWRIHQPPNPSPLPSCRAGSPRVVSGYLAASSPAGVVAAGFSLRSSAAPLSRRSPRLPAVGAVWPNLSAITWPHPPLVRHLVRPSSKSDGGSLGEGGSFSEGGCPGRISAGLGDARGAAERSIQKRRVERALYSCASVCANRWLARSAEIRTAQSRRWGRGLWFEKLPFGSVSSSSEEVHRGTYPVEKDHDQHPDDFVIAWRFVLSAVDDHPNPEGKKERSEDAHAAI